MIAARVATEAVVAVMTAKTKNILPGLENRAE